MPAPEVTLSEAVEYYLQNRAGFYETMLARLPDAGLQSRLRADVEPFSASPPLVDAIQEIPVALNDDLIEALKLLDLLKKPGHGAMLGRTTISVDEALARAQQIEQTGVVLLSALSMALDQTNSVLLHECERGKKILANLVRLDDELRYHRLRLTTSS